MRNKRYSYKLAVFFLFALMVGNIAYGQYDPRRSRWMRQRHQIGVTIGLTAFLGELGGADAIGSSGLRDWNFNQNRFALSLDYRYFLLRNLALRTEFIYAYVSGSDANTKEPFRRNRNLSFRAPIYEFSALLEFFILREEPGRGNPFARRRFTIDFYIFAGVGVTYFNPQAKFEGQWVDLQPLGTEGQGIDAQPDRYSKFTPVVPVGFGLAKKFMGFWSAGLEFSYRKTFTDYLDDVSTIYYDNNKIKATYGDVAAYLADPSLGYFIDGNGNQVPLNSTGEDLQRGDPNNLDAYLLGVINVRFYLAGLNKGRKRYKKSRF